MKRLFVASIFQEYAACGDLVERRFRQGDSGAEIEQQVQDLTMHSTRDPPDLKVQSPAGTDDASFGSSSRHLSGICG